MSDKINPQQFSLGELIEFLGSLDPTKTVTLGFGEPHSYRGYYGDLAFEPKEDVTIGEMLKDAKGALGAVYRGYKGGEYVMKDYTDVWLANRGECGESIGRVFLSLLLNKKSAG